MGCLPMKVRYPVYERGAKIFWGATAADGNGVPSLAAGTGLPALPSGTALTPTETAFVKEYYGK